MQRPFRPIELEQILPHTYEDIPRAFSLFELMRNQHPIFQVEQWPVWQVFRYEDVSTVITDYTRFSSRLMGGREGSLLADTLIAKDPPDHRKLRNLVNMAFTPRAVAHLSDRIAAITQELLDSVRAKGEMDVVEDLAFPLPARVIAEMLGVPEEDWDIWRRWARVDSSSPEARQQGNFVRRMREEMTDYFTALLAERRRVPRVDLITALSKAEIDGERLSEHDLVSFCFLLLAAGQETTKNLIANFTLCLTDRPGLQEQLVSEPALVPSAVEEVLRYLPPVWFLFRQTTTDVELGGVRIPAGQPVLAWIASANRDPDQFPHADQFDMKREPNRHLTFGHGIHFCVGAPLARLEARVALPMMLKQLKELRRVENIPIDIRSGLVFVIQNLPVTFQP